MIGTVTLPLLLALASSFDAFLAAPYPPADGFDPPPARGEIAAAANGRVIEAGLRDDGGVVAIEHIYYENHRRRVITSEYGGLARIDVKKDQIVRRGQKIGSAQGRIRFSLSPAFIRGRRRLLVPQEEAALVLVDQRTHQLALYERGRLIVRIEVGFGQRPGRKRRQGDLKTPRGMYFVVHKRRGEFTGPYGRYYGGHWIKLNYPNPWDAEWGVDKELLDRATADSIARSFAAKQLTDQRTPLGGGIGFHGWASDWSWEDTGWLSWGCVVLHNEDMQRIFDRIPVGAMVVLL